MQERLLRAIYGIEFLMALLVCLQVWSFVGGATHLDYVPWFWKGLLSAAVATAAIRITMAQTRRQTAKWVMLLFVLITACGLLSYYAHLTEPQDEEDDQEQTVPTSLQIEFQLPGAVRDLNQHRAIVL